ncbi:MAG TPA: hypothetical protein VL995_02085 [Cellvibrio sp.]|nr:hypothetical protein [Cellvibrio sp.]
MRAKSFNKCLAAYKELLNAGEVQLVYAGLVKYVQSLKTDFSKSLHGQYSVGNVFQGYMDYTYFYLSNSYLQDRKLKLALVFNHVAARFEIWLLGQTKEIQKKYWVLLKDTQWITTAEIPQYSIFEVSLVDKPDFDSLDKLTDNIRKNFTTIASAIIASIELADN